MNLGRPRPTFVCQECSAKTSKWEGRCPRCGQWNTLTSTIMPHDSKKNLWLLENSSEVLEVSKIPRNSVPRISTKSEEFDRVLGGGLVPGALVLMAGDPGIGKSTLLLQTSASLSRLGHKPMYISGEESAHQIYLRAERLGISGDGIFFLGETNLESILVHLDSTQPSFVVVDSVQTLFSNTVQSPAGSVVQVKECTRHLMRWCKASSTPTILTGHVTKEGSVAGPRTLEHMVDTVLYMEGDSFSPYRLLRGWKNRFGPTHEIGVFEMRPTGLEEVHEPSQLFLSSRLQDVPGSTVVATMEGTRPILAEIQALTTPTIFTQPRRTVTGIDFHRLMLVTATVTKHLSVPLGGQDIVVNVTGGLRIQEPAADLGVALALISSARNTPCDPSMVVIGEVGLGGELRGITQIDRRLNEAARLGFKKALIPEMHRNDVGEVAMTILPVSTLSEAIYTMFPKAHRRNKSI